MKLNTLIFLMKEILMCTHTRLIDKNIEMSTPYVLPLIEGLFFYRLGIFKYQRLSWKSCAPPLVFPSGSFVARIIT